MPEHVSQVTTLEVQKRSMETLLFAAVGTAHSKSSAWGRTGAANIANQKTV
jgi:hypothetical protein